MSNYNSLAHFKDILRYRAPAPKLKLHIEQTKSSKHVNIYKLYLYKLEEHIFLMLTS